MDPAEAEKQLLFGIADFCARGIRDKNVAQCRYLFLGNFAHIQVDHHGRHPDACESYSGTAEAFVTAAGKEPFPVYFIPVKNQIREKMITLRGIRSAGMINWRGIRIGENVVKVRTKVYTFWK